MPARPGPRPDVSNPEERSPMPFAKLIAVAAALSLFAVSADARPRHHHKHHNKHHQKHHQKHHRNAHR